MVHHVGQFVHRCEVLRALPGVIADFERPAGDSSSRPAATTFIPLTVAPPAPGENAVVTVQTGQTERLVLTVLAA